MAFVLGHWNLELGICLEFGAWDLEFYSYLSLVTRYSSRVRKGIYGRIDSDSFNTPLSSEGKNRLAGSQRRSQFLL
jgi:hypothetical protein